MVDGAGWMNATKDLGDRELMIMKIQYVFLVGVCQFRPLRLRESEGDRDPVDD